jgi:hypothetical protein
MIGWLRKVFGRSTSVDAVGIPTADSEGPLLGLSPPEGCFFRVELGSNPEWVHVHIVRGNRVIVHELDRFASYKPGSEHLAVHSAAQKALESYHRLERFSHFTGNYPPNVLKAGE